MRRNVTLVLLALALLSGAFGCSGRDGATPSPSSPTVPAGPASGATADPGPRPTLAGYEPGTAPTPVSPLPSAAAPWPAADSRLPAVLAQVSFAPEGGDAYTARALAFDEAGRAIVLCDHAGTSPNAALVVVDPSRGTRGPVLPLPFGAPLSIAAGGGRVFVDYLLGANRNPGLAAIDPETGRVLATAPATHEDPTRSLLADAAGRVYLPLADRMEVRDGATLAVVGSLPWPPEAFAADPNRGRASALIDPTGTTVYVSTPERLRAYRTGDLSPLWEATYPTPLTLDVGLLADAAGRNVYAWSRSADGQVYQTVVLGYAAASGRALEPLRFSTDPQAPGLHLPAGGSWWPLYVDSRQGYLVFRGPDSRGYPLLWKTGLDGRPALAQPVTVPFHVVLGAHEGRLLLQRYDGHQLAIYDLANLEPVGQVLLGVDLVDLIADPDLGRVYVNDAAGRLHVLDGRDYHVIASLQAGRGALTLDAASGLLFVPREPFEPGVAVVDTRALTVTTVITGGDRVAVDPAGRRAFVGQRRSAAFPTAVQVWDTRTFRRVGSIAHVVEPAYNPLRDEVYVIEEGAARTAVMIVDGKSLQPAGRLPLDPGSSIVVDAGQELIVSLAAPSHEGGLSPDPRFLSARTLEPLTHPATRLCQPDGSGLVLVPAEEGRVYTGPRQDNPRGVSTCPQLTVWRAGTDEVIDRREGLCLDLYLPGTGVGLMLVDGNWQAFDLGTWEPLGSFAGPGLRRLDPVARRLYAWEGSTLTVLGYGGD